MLHCKFPKANFGGVPCDNKWAWSEPETNGNGRKRTIRVETVSG
jgi:hypothetical protein